MSCDREGGGSNRDVCGSKCVMMMRLMMKMLIEGSKVMIVMMMLSEVMGG